MVGPSHIGTDVMKPVVRLASVLALIIGFTIFFSNANEIDSAEYATIKTHGENNPTHQKFINEVMQDGMISRRESIWLWNEFELADQKAARVALQESAK